MLELQLELLRLSPPGAACDGQAQELARPAPCYLTICDGDTGDMVGQSMMSPTSDKPSVGFRESSHTPSTDTGNHSREAELDAKGPPKQQAQSTDLKTPKSSCLYALKSSSSSMELELDLSRPLPERAFVVNVRRLCETREALELLHECLLTTAVAALTLVSAGTKLQLQNTVLFIICVISVFTIHNHRHDRWAIDDFTSIIQLQPPLPGDHENRILRSLTVGRSQLQRILGKALGASLIGVLVFLWWIIKERWAMSPEEFLVNVPWASDIVDTEDDFAALSMQLVVLTFMFFLHVIYCLIHIYETQMVMPFDEDGHVWDVRAKGVPCRFQIFGLPSMWFASETAKQDLLRSVGELHHGIVTSELFPEELALYALEGDEKQREDLARNLKEARTENEEGESREALNLELCFFVSETKSPGMPHAGAFAQVAYETELEQEPSKLSVLGHHGSNVSC